MSCRVNVWLPHSGMVGHASLHAGATYLSWWPDSAAYAQAGNGQPIPGRANTWATDVGDATLGEGRAPHHRSTPIDGLDEAAIVGWWDAFRVENASRWNMGDSNCAWVVLTALKIGGADRDWVFANFFDRLMYPPSPVDCQTAAEILVGRTQGAFNTAARYLDGKIGNPLRNATAYVQAIRLKSP